MKTRNGYVSNSSSSSFIIAFGQPQKCACCGKNGLELLGYMPDILKSLGYVKVKEEKERRSSLYNEFEYNGKVSDAIEHYNEMVKKAKEAKITLENKVRDLEKMLKDKSVLAVAGVVMSKIRLTTRSSGWNEALMEARCESGLEDEGGAGKIAIEREIRDTQRFVRTLNEGMATIEKMIEKAKDHPDWDILTIELDNMDWTFKNLFSEMEKNGYVVVLNKISN